MYYKSRGYRIFNLFNLIFLLVCGVICVLPLFHILAVSLSSKGAADANMVNFIPVEFTWDAYEETLENDRFFRAFMISVQRTVVGTAFGMFIMTMAAYPLSKSSKVFKGRTFLAWFFVFTLFFGGGLIPSYILILKLGLMNSFWALIIPGAVSVWSVVLLMNFFRTVPKEMEDAALIDGAGDFRALFSIYLPVSMPAIATLSLFSIVGAWNSWFDGMIYMKDADKYPLATFMQSIVVKTDFSLITSGSSLDNISQRTVKAAQIFIGILPILLVYPFMQKYFVKGIVVGAVKE